MWKNTQLWITTRYFLLNALEKSEQNPGRYCRCRQMLTGSRNLYKDGSITRQFCYSFKVWVFFLSFFFFLLWWDLIYLIVNSLMVFKCWFTFFFSFLITDVTCGFFVYMVCTVHAIIFCVWNSNLAVTRYLSVG